MSLMRLFTCLKRKPKTQSGLDIRAIVGPSNQKIFMHLEDIHVPKDTEEVSAYRVVPSK